MSLPPQNCPVNAPPSPPSQISGSKQPLTNPSAVQEFVQRHHFCPVQYSFGQFQQQAALLCHSQERQLLLNFFRKSISCASWDYLILDPWSEAEMAFLGDPDHVTDLQDPHHWSPKSPLVSSAAPEASAIIGDVTPSQLSLCSRLNPGRISEFQQDTLLGIWEGGENTDGWMNEKETLFLQIWDICRDQGCTSDICRDSWSRLCIWSRGGIFAIMQYNWAARVRAIQLGIQFVRIIIAQIGPDKQLWTVGGCT